MIILTYYNEFNDSNLSDPSLYKIYFGIDECTEIDLLQYFEEAIKIFLFGIE